MNHVAATAATALIAAIWQGAVLATIVSLTLRLLPAISAATRSLIWTATFALLVVLHFFPVVHPPATATGSTHPLHFAPAWSLAVALLWLGLSLFRGGQMVFSALRLRQIDRRAVPVSPSFTNDFRHSERTDEPLYFALPHPRGSNRPYTLCTSPDVDRPSVLGFFHPRILLPEGLLETLAPAELQQILLHETEHLRRSDDWTNLLQKLALVLFPLNPVLFWVERRLCLERELACDARVLSAGADLRKSYATTLTRLAEHSILRRGLNLALGILGHRPRASELATRVHRILARPAKTLNPRQTRFATATVLAGVLGLATTFAYAPSLITFTPEAVREQAVNPLAPGLASETWAPKLVAAKGPIQNAHQPSYKAVEMVAKASDAPLNRIRKVHPLQRRRSSPRLIDVRYRNSENYAQPRLMLTVAAVNQVQQFVVPTFVYIPAYAAVHTSEGWIVFQL